MLIARQLVQYGAYHHTIGNRLIHHICVPIICWYVELPHDQG